jgi:hypothetical protein
MDDAKSVFERVAKMLDELYLKAEPGLRSEGFEVEERSARTYHYKNNHLFWSCFFLKTWLLDLDRARVTVHVSYGEPATLKTLPAVEVTWRAEVFREGQRSRTDEKGIAAYSTDDLQREGLAAIVLKAFTNGAALLVRCEVSQ